MDDELGRDKVRVPKEAYDFVPSEYQIFHGKGKNAQRFIFRDKQLTDFENEKLTRLESELQKSKIDPYKLNPEWTRNELLRFCYGTGWKTRVAKETYLKYLKFIETIKPNGYISLFPRVHHILRSGCMYIHGRDSLFRPILVINFNRYDFKKVNFTKISIQEHIYAISFFLDYVIDNMMLPGKIENWVVITDFEKNGFGDVNLGGIKQVMNVLTDNYRCRLGVNYVVNPAKSVFYIWTVIKPFLEEALIEKVKIINSGTITQLFEHCNPYQVEVKYGGKAPVLTNFWPPHMPNAPYSVNGLPSDIQNHDEKIEDQGLKEFQSIPHKEKIEIEYKDPSINRIYLENFDENNLENHNLEKIEDQFENHLQIDVEGNKRKKNKKKKRKEKNLSEEERQKEDDCLNVSKENLIEYGANYDEKNIKIDDKSYSDNIKQLSPENVSLYDPKSYSNVSVDDDLKNDIGCNMCSGLPNMASKLTACIIF